MKIDIHLHTKATKNGDSITRNVTPELFRDKIMASGVRIAAVTNHNLFDLEQFKSLQQAVVGECIVWPGVELDVIGANEERGHILIICDPSKCEEFSMIVENICRECTPDTLSVDYRDLIIEFKSLDCLYIVHYKKDPELSEKTIEYISENIVNKGRLLKETTNLISASIFANHGINVIVGSDVQNWDNYEDVAENLPELKLPVDSFLNFCKLLDKEENVIENYMNQKTSTNMQLKLMDKQNVLDSIDIKIREDINIIFGDKGTGKSKLLEAIEREYKRIGKSKACVYKSGEQKLSDVYGDKSNTPRIAKLPSDYDNCQNEIRVLMNYKDEDIENISKYVKVIESKAKNTNAQKMSIGKLQTSTSELSKNELEDGFRIRGIFKNFVDVNKREYSKIVKIIEEELYSEMIDVINRVSEKIDDYNSSKFVETKSTLLYNNIIEVFRDEIKKKTATESLPISTGFARYARNKLDINLALNKIIDNLSMEVVSKEEVIGTLTSKGTISYLESIVHAPNVAGNSKYVSIKDAMAKSKATKIANSIKEIEKKLYDSNFNDLYANFLRELKELDISDFDTLDKLLVIKKSYIDKNGNDYTPSLGEQSILLLQRELKIDKEIFIIDEPERSLGNLYISNDILPLIKEKAKSGKTFIIATHDANIAVRSLPYVSIYRTYSSDGKYKTYYGNPFLNKMKLVKENGELDELNFKIWNEVSQDVLEGGKEAFGERGNIYEK